MIDSSEVSISVIVPTFNRPTALRRCLESLVAQDYPISKIEVIVVNDGGVNLADDTYAALRGFGSLIIVDQPNRGPAAARNHGARVASANQLAFIDDDCIAACDWLSTICCKQNGNNHLIIGGCTLNGLADNIFAQANAELITYLYKYYHQTPGEKSQPPFFSTNNMSLSLLAFQEIGGFDERLRTAEDRDFCERLREAGFPFYYAPEMVVHHYHGMNMKGFLELHFIYGRGNYRFHEYRQVRGWGNYRLEPWRFYTGMIQHPFKATHQQKALWISMLFALSQVCNVSGFVSQAIISRLKANET